MPSGVNVPLTFEIYKIDPKGESVCADRDADPGHHQGRQAVVEPSAHRRRSGQPHARGHRDRGSGRDLHHRISARPRARWSTGRRSTRPSCSRAIRSSSATPSWWLPWASRSPPRATTVRPRLQLAPQTAPQASQRSTVMGMAAPAAPQFAQPPAPSFPGAPGGRSAAALQPAGAAAVRAAAAGRSQSVRAAAGRAEPVRRSAGARVRAARACVCSARSRRSRRRRPPSRRRPGRRWRRRLPGAQRSRWLLGPSGLRSVGRRSAGRLARHRSQRDVRGRDRRGRPPLEPDRRHRDRRDQGPPRLWRRRALGLVHQLPRRVRRRLRHPPRLGRLGTRPASRTTSSCCRMTGRSSTSSPF